LPCSETADDSELAAKAGQVVSLAEEGIKFLRNNHADLLNNLQEKINQFADNSNPK